MFTRSSLLKSAHIVWQLSKQTVKANCQAVMSYLQKQQEHEKKGKKKTLVTFHVHAKVHKVIMFTFHRHLNILNIQLVKS